MKDKVLKKFHTMNGAEKKTSRKEQGTYFRMCALSLVKKNSKQERRKAEKRRKTLQKPAGNSLFLSKHIADTDLSWSQHLLPTRRVSLRYAEPLLHT